MALDLARQCDVVISLLTDAAAIESVYGGPDGLFSAPQALLIEMSTVAPEFQAQMGQRAQQTVAAALQAAKEIASKPPVAIWGTKQVLHYARDHSTEDSLRHMGWLQGAIWSNENVREAINAFQQKREANFPPLPALKGFREFG